MNNYIITLDYSNNVLVQSSLDTLNVHAVLDRFCNSNDDLKPVYTYTYIEKLNEIDVKEIDNYNIKYIINLDSETIVEL